MYMYYDGCDNLTLFERIVQTNETTTYHSNSENIDVDMYIAIIVTCSVKSDSSLRKLNYSTIEIYHCS